MGHLSKVLGARLKAGCGVGKLRLGKTHLLVEDTLKVGVQVFVGELEFSNEDAKPRGMEFLAVYTTGILGKPQSWALVIIDRFVVPRTDGTPSLIREGTRITRDQIRYITFPSSSR